MDLEQAKKEFLNYVSNYDETNFSIKRKRDHSLRVMQISEEIAKKLGLEPEEIELSALIGLLHDIARFDQIKIYNTFKDKISFDHGEYAVKILTKDNYIRKYIQIDKYDEIIKIAIKNHNKLDIEEGLNNKQLIFSKIIRDADKLDILYQATYLSWPDTMKEIEQAKLTPDDIKSFIEERTVDREKDLLNVGKIKRVLITLGFPYGINYNVTFELLKEADYINKIINRFNFEDKQTKDLIEQIRTILNNYISIKQKG